MKALKNILGVTAIATVTLTSCLKDKKVSDQEYGMINYDTKKIIELPAPPTNVITHALDFIDKEVTLDFATVGLAADLPATEDIVVTLSMANSGTIISDYNTANPSAHVVAFPANLYSIQGSGLTVTIPKGSRFGKVQIKTNTIGFNPSNTYGIGFTVTAVDKSGYTISGNFGKVLVLIGAKNKYDGIYKAKGYGNLGGNTTAPYLFSVECSWELNLVTASGNSVYMDAQPLFRNGSIIYFSNVFPKFNFDLTTNKVVSMSNDAPGNGIPFNFPIDGGTYDSRYDPATKTIYVRFGLNNSATWRVVDTLTYCGPR